MLATDVEGKMLFSDPQHRYPKGLLIVTKWVGSVHKNVFGIMCTACDSAT
jgi:hypothetical protein